MSQRSLLVQTALICAILTRDSGHAAQCVGDCNNDGTVAVEEMLSCVDGALDTAPILSCCDPDQSGGVTVDELVGAVTNALSGCGAAKGCSYPFNATCEAGEMCDVHDARCTYTWLVGSGENTCVLTPTICPPEYDPVCGCDGVTYANDCERLRAGAAWQATGVCREFSCCPADAIVPGTILVRFQEGTTPEQATAIAQSLGATVQDLFFRTLYTVRVPAMQEADFVSRFAARPAVAGAWPDRVRCIPGAVPCACCPPDERCVELPPCMQMEGQFRY